MRGTMLIFKPGELNPDGMSFGRPAKLEELKWGIGGGYLELVPHFTTIAVSDVVMDCVAMCDEDGKRKQLPVNQIANDLWQESRWRKFGCSEPMGDHLVGNIIVLFGDREFMRSL